MIVKERWLDRLRLPPALAWCIVGQLEEEQPIIAIKLKEAELR